MKVLEPPSGCMETAGYILVVEEGIAWLTKDGWVTTEFKERGVWATPEEAELAKELLVKIEGEIP